MIMKALAFIVVFIGPVVGLKVAYGSWKRAFKFLGIFLFSIAGLVTWIAAFTYLFGNILFLN